MARLSESKLRAWSLRVRRAANFVCDNCKRKSRSNAHHLNDKSTYPKQAYDDDNGKCLCDTCHDDFHIRFMGGYHVSCTKKDYYAWKGSNWTYWILALMVGVLLL